jgi:predicted dehydrogenase
VDTVAILGAGNFAVRTLLPALAAVRPRPGLAWVVSARGATALTAARRQDAARVSTDAAPALADPAVETVFIATRHARHAAEACAALAAGKHVWVEKPLALTESELAVVLASAGAAARVLMVGFNRRFAPATARVRAAIAHQPGGRTFTLTVNAGRLPSDHWALDPAEGGGRIVGEACHFIDLLRHLSGSPIVGADGLTRDRDGQDGGRFELRFANGDVARLLYLTDLPPRAPKELLHVAGEGWSLDLEHWRSLRVTGLPGHGWSSWFGEPDKGHAAALAAFHAATAGRAPAPIPLAELAEVSRWAIRLQAMPV